jgi:RNA polymerase sigma-70 factor, ECF subfamily
VQAARKGDRAALATLLRELQDPWYRFSLSLLGDADRAREATQETGLRFLKTIAAFRGDSQLQTWTLGIALNVVREMRRKGRPIPIEGQEHLATSGAARRAAAESPEAAADSAEQRQRLHAVLADLPERQREAVVLRFFEDLSVQDTARAMSCAEGTVKATVHQALRSMKQRLTAAVKGRRAKPAAVRIVE